MFVTFVKLKNLLKSIGSHLPILIKIDDFRFESIVEIIEIFINYKSLCSQNVSLDFCVCGHLIDRDIQPVVSQNVSTKLED